MTKNINNYNKNREKTFEVDFQCNVMGMGVVYQQQHRYVFR